MEIIVASISILASVTTVSLTYFFTKRHQLRMEERRIKEEYYKSFIKALSDVAIDNKEEAQKRLSEGFNSLIVIGSIEVVKKLMEFHNFVKIENTSIPRNSEEWSMRHDDILNELVIAMRCDLFGSKATKDKFPRIHLVGRGIGKK